MAEEGGRRRRWAALAPVAWAGLIFLLSHQPRLPFSEAPFPHFDKVAHAGAYAILAALLARALRAAGLGRRATLLAAVAIASLYGVTDEWHQSFVPGRDPDPRDWAADTAGALLGALAAVGLPGTRSRASIRG